VSLTRRLTRSVALGIAVVGCASQNRNAAAPAPPPPPVSAAPAPTAPVATAPDPEPPKAAGPGACGALGCRLFDTPEAAFAAVLEAQPRVLAVGESHAQKGSEGIASSTVRFKEQFLPALKGRATDLILELMLPNPKCQKEAKAVKKRQEPVTEPQADTNQDEFTTLARSALILKIAPHVLRPSCAELDEVLKAGGGDIAVMLKMIAKLSVSTAKPFIDRNASLADDKFVLLYGGALHNDLEPRGGREEFSFGPELKTMTAGRYVELDLIVPEFIKDNETWRSLPWYAHFDPRKAPEKTTLFNPSPGSYVLIFPRSK
jgi:hypothetical protein